jgi:glucose-6-phosphate isomerase
MESNGKTIALNGAVVSRQTGPIVWGEPGTNGQHAFYQLLHQGSRIIPCEFLVAAQSHEENLPQHHQLLLASCLAQSEALMRGRSQEEVADKLIIEGPDGETLDLTSHKAFPGNRPSTTLVYQKLTPRTLGRIIALYEHRVFVEGIIWGVNSFDQWGVELGKELAACLLPHIGTEIDCAEKDGSTRGLLQTIARLRRT